MSGGLLGWPALGPQTEVALKTGEVHKHRQAASEAAAAVITAEAELQSVNAEEARIRKQEKQVDCAEDAKEQRAATKAVRAKQLA